MNRAYEHGDIIATTAPEEIELGLAMLVLETEDGEYLPISVVSTVREAKELASSDVATRLRNLDKCAEPLCPYTYRLWARGANGAYRVKAEMPVDSNGE